jgi:hypothetical protein
MEDGRYIVTRQRHDRPYSCTSESGIRVSACHHRGVTGSWGNSSYPTLASPQQPGPVVSRALQYAARLLVPCVLQLSDVSANTDAVRGRSWPQDDKLPIQL